VPIVHTSAHYASYRIGAERPSRAAGERDDLKALLVATLQRLETVDDVVRRADMSNAMMEERVAVLEQERKAAMDAAAAAQARAETLLKSQRRIEWQNKVRTQNGPAHTLPQCWLSCGCQP
jgi:hypothetical protein